MKTKTKKSSEKKASTKKVVSTTKAKKPVPKKSLPLTVPPAPKKAVKKSAPVKKTVSVKTQLTPKRVESKTSIHSSSVEQASSKEGVKMLGILHLVGNLFSGGILGILLVIIYYFFRHEKLSKLEKDTCFEIINFNLSFLVYSFIAGLIFGLGLLLVFVLVGFVLLPVLPLVVVTWFVLMIIGFLKHLEGENYKYPFIIRFVA